MKAAGLGFLALSGATLWNSGLDITGAERKRAFLYLAVGGLLVWRGKF